MCPNFTCVFPLCLSIFMQNIYLVYETNWCGEGCNFQIITFDYIYPFLGGLSLHLNHLIASHEANYDWPFGTLPFGLFGSNLDTRDLETYPRTYSGHF